MKERFTQEYNREHGRRGTLWEGRFHSVLVQGGDPLVGMAAYDEANPVRAGMVDKPEFVNEMFGRFREQFSAKRVEGAKRMRGVAEELYVLREPGGPLFG